jgi:guanylate kinase
MFVIAAPSGAGKSSLVKALRQQDARLRPTISHTTRAPRGQEVHGKEYFFVNDEAFDALIAQGAFVEWAYVHQQRYGTSKQAIADQLSQGVDLVFEIDYQGALQLQKLYTQSTTIFILPPSWDELRSRLERRGEDSEKVIEVRLRNAALEMAQVSKFDFVIINETFDQAFFELKSIVHAQRLRYSVQRMSRPDVFKALHLP